MPEPSAERADENDRDGARPAGDQDPIEVGFNLLWLVPGVVGGTEEATVELLTALAEDQPAGLHHRLYALESFAATHPRIAGRYPTRLLPLRGRLKPLRVLAEGTWLANATRRDGIQLVHHLGGTLPPRSMLPAVVTLHDLQPFDLPENFHITKRLYLHRAVPRTVRKARFVHVHSEFVANGVIERFGVDPARVVVVPAGVQPLPSLVHESSPEDLRARYGLPERWFIYPAITYPHKNHVTLVRAFAGVVGKDPDAALVLTGRSERTGPLVEQEIARLGLEGKVVRTGRIPRGDLLGLMVGAVALTFPSRYEGFGLPVLEAMALGTPVIAADSTALPEVVGPAGVLVPPDDPDSWTDAMLEALSGRDRERWARAGRERAAELSWARAATGIAQLHRDALAMEPTEAEERAQAESRAAARSAGATGATGAANTTGPADTRGAAGPTGATGAVGGAGA
ncbi:MAG TPA: glycosyltransferase family 1 protein [Acidimicrobiales bacterium]